MKWKIAIIDTIATALIIWLIGSVFGDTKDEIIIEVMWGSVFFLAGMYTSYRLHNE